MGNSTIESLIHAWKSSNEELCSLPDVAIAIERILAAVKDFHIHWQQLIAKGNDVANSMQSSIGLSADLQLHQQLEHQFAKMVAELTEQSPTVSMLRPSIDVSIDGDVALLGVNELRDVVTLSRAHLTDVAACSLVAETIRVSDVLYADLRRVETAMYQGLMSFREVDPYGRLSNYTPPEVLLDGGRSNLDDTFAMWLNHLLVRRDVTRAMLAILGFEIGKRVSKDAGSVELGAAFIQAVRRWRRHFEFASLEEKFLLERVWQFSIDELSIDDAPWQLRDEYQPAAIEIEDVFSVGNSHFDNWSLVAQKKRNAFLEPARRYLLTAPHRSSLAERIIQRLDDCAAYIGEWAMHRMMLNELVEDDPVLDDHIRTWSDCLAAVSTTATHFPIPHIGMVIPVSEDLSERPILPVVRGVRFGMGGAPPPISRGIDELVVNLDECLYKREAIIFDIREQVMAYMGGIYDRPPIIYGESLPSAEELRNWLYGRMSERLLSHHDRIICQLHLARLDILDLRFDEFSEWFGRAMIGSVNSDSDGDLLINAKRAGSLGIRLLEEEHEAVSHPLGKEAFLRTLGMALTELGIAIRPERVAEDLCISSSSAWSMHRREGTGR